MFMLFLPPLFAFWVRDFKSIELCEAKIKISTVLNKYIELRV